MIPTNKSLLEMTLSTITALDTVLDIQRLLLLDAKDEAARSKVRGQINGMLDERIVMMKQRDELMAASSVEQSEHPR